MTIELLNSGKTFYVNFLFNSGLIIIKEMIVKLMPGDSIEYKTKDGMTKVLTLCERTMANSKISDQGFQQRTRNQEAVRLSEGLLIELRRTTTIVKQ